MVRKKTGKLHRGTGREGLALVSFHTVSNRFDLLSLVLSQENHNRRQGDVHPSFDYKRIARIRAGALWGGSVKCAGGEL